MSQGRSQRLACGRRTAAAVLAILATAATTASSTTAKAGAPAAATVEPASPEAQFPEALTTSWRLVKFQSMDDAIGTRTPANPDQYQMTLNGDGRVLMKLNCNRGSGKWSARPSGSTSGGFDFTLRAVTRAACPPPNLDQQLTRDLDLVASYLLRDGRLHLSLPADAGIYTWEKTTAPKGN